MRRNSKRTAPLGPERPQCFRLARTYQYNAFKYQKTQKNSKNAILLTQTAPSRSQHDWNRSSRRAAALTGAWRRMRRRSAAPFIQFVCLTLLHTTQVVAQPKVIGKCSRFAKTVAAAEAQRQANFGGAVTARGGSDEARSCGVWFVFPRSTKPWYWMHKQRSSRPVSEAKTVAAVRGG